MKRALVVTLMALTLACVLPMAQAQPQHEPVPEHAVTVPHQDSEPLTSLAVPAGQSSDSFEQQMDRLKQQMEQLQQQMQQLVKQRENLAKQVAELSVERAHAAAQAAGGTGVLQTHAVKEGDKAVVPHARVSMPGVPHAPIAPTPHVSSTKVETSVDGEYAVKAVKAQTLLKIENQVGSITVKGADQPDCTIKTVIKAGAATKERADEMAGQVKIRVTPEEGVIRVGADIPEDLRNNKEGEGIQVSFEVTVPRHVNVQAAQKVGDIRLSSIAGDVKAVTDVGAIRASGLNADASLATNVGDIHVTVPPDASAKVNAKVEVGAIRSDILDVTGASELKAGGIKVALGSSASGTLGDGRHRVNLKSQVGQIRIQSETSSNSSNRF
jgi:TolA-binding protein